MDKKRKLIIIPLGGLGNRMRVISSCVEIAKRDNRSVWIVWPINEDLGCDIVDIFESIGIDYSVPPRWIHYLLTRFYRLSAISRFYRAYKWLSGIFFDKSVFDRDIWESNTDIKIDSNASTLLVATCLAFNDQDFSLFRFIDYLKNKVDLEYGRIGEKYIGVHIRRTDHANTIKHSPDKNYFSQIDKCLSENPRIIFFLASDDEETKTVFKKKYLDRIYTLNYKLARNDLEGIYGGVVELILLSKSSKIICSVISSYSMAAISIGNIKDVIFVDSFIGQDMVRQNGKLQSQFKNL